MWSLYQNVHLYLALVILDSSFLTNSSICTFHLYDTLRYKNYKQYCISTCTWNFNVFITSATVSFCHFHGKNCVVLLSPLIQGSFSPAQVSICLMKASHTLVKICLKSRFHHCMSCFHIFHTSSTCMMKLCIQ